MPLFRVEISRDVSRKVELRQTASIWVKATDPDAARSAAYDAIGDENEMASHATDWKDDNGSRQASNDEVERRARVDYVFPTAVEPMFLKPLDAMPEPESKETEE